MVYLKRPSNSGIYVCWTSIGTGVFISLLWVFGVFDLLNGVFELLFGVFELLLFKFGVVVLFSFILFCIFLISNNEYF